MNDMKFTLVVYFWADYYFYDVEKKNLGDETWR